MKLDFTFVMNPSPGMAGTDFSTVERTSECQRDVLMQAAVTQITVCGSMVLTLR